MEGCGKIMKYLLVIFNLLVLIIGLIAVGLGIWALVSDYGADEMRAITGSNLYKAGCIVTIVGGCVIAIISFLGCCGAWKENRCLLGIYFIIMLLFLILFVVAAVLGFFFRDDLEDELSKEMTKTLKEKYDVNVDSNDDNKAVTDVWDKIQKELECCGVEGGRNSATSWYLWQQSAFFLVKQAAVLPDNRIYVPASCCNTGLTNFQLSDCQTLKATMAPNKNNSAVTDDNPALYQNGCIDKVKDKIDTYIVAVAVTGVVALIIILCCVIFSVCVCMEVKRKEMVV